MDLNYVRQGKGPNLLILHGFLGSLDNWQTQAKKLAENYTVWTIDQRNHGRSPHSNEHSYDLMAADLRDFCSKHHLEKFHLLGHSMGAKTAMFFANEHESCLQSLILVDMGIKAYPGGHETILEALNGLPVATMKSRREAEDMLAEKISAQGVRQFLLKSLARNNTGGFRWRFNLSALTKNYDEVLKPFSPHSAIKVPTMFVRGEKSPYLPYKDWDSIQKAFPEATLETVHGAGHWVHAEAAQPFFKTISKFLENIPQQL